jgi:hypothetical protein
MDLLPGPGAFRGPLPLGPRVATPHLFEQLADDLVPTLAGADAGLGAHSETVGRDVPADIESTYATTAGVAEERNATQSGAQDVTTAPALIDTGTGAETYREAALPYLPQPSTPITVDFTDPPPPPAPGGSPEPGGGPPLI